MNNQPNARGNIRWRCAKGRLGEKARGKRGREDARSKSVAEE